MKNPQISSHSINETMPQKSITVPLLQIQNLQNQVSQLQKNIMEYINYQDRYQINDIPISDTFSFQSETIHTIFIRSSTQNNNYIYIGHGFGGTSLMYFSNLNLILEKANVILWQIRGMGLNIKPSHYQINEIKQIKDFYINGLKSVIQFYNHPQITLISHSFSAYISMRYVIEQEQRKSKIKKIILLSPVGITPKQLDYKNKINSCSDVKNYLIAKLGWRFKLTYKSPMRTICRCFKEKLLKGAFSEYKLVAQQLDKLVKLFLLMIKLQDGSQNIFFDFFEPRVLPKDENSIVQILQKKQSFNLQTRIFFGQNDWADRLGSYKLTEKYQNWTTQIIKNSDHMLPFSKQAFDRIIQNYI